METRTVLAVIAALCAALTLTPVRAATIEILQVNNHLAAGTPAPPAGFTLLDLGTGAPDSLQTTFPFTVGGVTFSFSGGSGEFAGNAGSSSPFGFSNATTNFVQAAGNGGTVNVTWATTQNELFVLWGTVDPETGRNRITIGATQIDGAEIVAAIMSQGFPFFVGQSNTYLKITGLPDFTSATFSDNQQGSFEFALGVAQVPVPAALPLFATGLGVLGWLGWRRTRKQASRSCSNARGFK